MNLKSFILIVCCFTPIFVGAQDYDGYKGKGSFQPYDKAYINPSYRGKHGASLGLAYASVSPLNSFDPQWGINLGYNYLMLYKRRRIFGIKEVFRDEIKMGFGLHLHYFFNSEWYLHANYVNPTISLRGKLFSFYFFNELGLGLHRSPPKLDSPSKVRFNVSFEALRIRFGKSPLNLAFMGFYDAGSALLSKDRMDLAITTKLSYYIYDKHKNRNRKSK